MSFNTAQIKDRAREVLGQEISDQQAQDIMNSTQGGDENLVMSFLQTQGLGQVETGSGVDDFIKSLVDPILTELTQFEKRVKDFGLEGPFAFDEALARESSAEIADPYYDQLLNEFVQGVEINRKQSLENERELLSNLTREREYESGELRQKIEDAIETTREGYETQGLFASGLQKRASGRLEAEGNTRQSRMGELFGQEEGSIRTRGKQLGEQLDLQRGIGERQLGTERRETIESGVEARRSQAQQATEIERIQSTALPFIQKSEDAMNRLLQFS